MTKKELIELLEGYPEYSVIEQVYDKEANVKRWKTNKGEGL